MSAPVEDLDDFWIEVVDLSDALKADGFEAQREAILKAIHNSAWYATTIGGDRLDTLLQGFAEADTVMVANLILADIWDLADEERVYLQVLA